MSERKKVVLFKLRFLFYHEKISCNLNNKIRTVNRLKREGERCDSKKGYMAKSHKQMPKVIFRGGLNTQLLFLNIRTCHESLHAYGPESKQTHSFFDGSDVNCVDLGHLSIPQCTSPLWLLQ